MKALTKITTAMTALVLTAAPAFDQVRKLL